METTSIIQVPYKLRPLLSAFAFLSAISWADFRYQQFSEHFARKLIPSSKKQSVSLGELADITNECASNFVVETVRQIFKRPQGIVVFDDSEKFFALAENGGSYGAFLKNGRFTFKGDDETFYRYRISQSSVFSRTVKNPENQEELPFYYSGPFVFAVSENRKASYSYWVLRFMPLIFQSFTSKADYLSTWGEERTLPILYANLLPVNRHFLLEEEKSYARDKKLEELYLFSPFYLREKESFYLDDAPTEFAFNRVTYEQCLERIAE